MKIEKLDVGNKKVKVAFILGIILTATIFILINYVTSRASYRNTQSIDLATGTINYKLPDLNVIAMYKDGVATDTMPGEDYKIDTEQSYCYTTDSSQHDGTVELYTNLNGEHVMKNLKKVIIFIKKSIK